MPLVKYDHTNSTRDVVELFYNTWHVVTRSVVRAGPRSVSWVIYADLLGTGRVPSSIVAGGVCDNELQARSAIRGRFELWTLTGPAAMHAIGPAGF